jgi:hypothetical protein
MPAQIIEREVIVAIEQSCLGLHPDKRGAKDFSDQGGPQFFRAHQRARDFRCAIILLRKCLIRNIWSKVMLHPASTIAEGRFDFVELHFGVRRGREASQGSTSFSRSQARVLSPNAIGFGKS